MSSRIDMPYIWHYCFCILLHNACKTHIHRAVYVVAWCLGYFYPSLARSFWTYLAGFRHKGCLRLIIHCRTRVSASSKHIRYVILDSCSKFQLSRFSRSWHVDRRTSVIKLLSCPTSLSYRTSTFACKCRDAERRTVRLWLWQEKLNQYCFD